MTSVHGILQARILEWVAMLSSRASSWPKDENPRLLGFLHWQMGSLTLGPSGKPQWFYKQKKFRDRQLDRENGMWRWRCITQERGLEQILPSGPQRKPTILTSWSQISSLWTMKQLHFCLFKATQSVVLCYSTLSKLIQIDSLHPFHVPEGILALLWTLLCSPWKLYCVNRKSFPSLLGSVWSSVSAIKPALPTAVMTTTGIQLRAHMFAEAA